MKERYYDKNGREILAGMTIQHEDGDRELIYASADENDLGMNASNEDHVSFTELNRKIYPLYQFNLKEWKIVE